MRNTKTSEASLLAGFLVCGLGALFYCYEYLLRIEPSVMVPQLMHEFAVTASSLGLLTALYYYAYTPMQLIVGMLIDRFGTRMVITLAVFLCATGSAVFANAHSVYVAGMGRFLIGFGSAFAFVAVLKLAAVWLPKHYFALFAGLATALGMLGAMVGDVELTVLVHKIGWKSALDIGTVIGFILVPIIWLLIRDKPKYLSHDVEHNTHSYKQTFLGLWVIIKNPQMWLAGAIGCMLFLSLSVVAELWGIPFLSSVYKLPAHSAAFACALIFLGWLVGSPINGWISDHTKTRRIPLIIGSLFALIIFAMILYKAAFITPHVLWLLLFLFGFFSSVEVICFAVCRENNPTHIAATSIAFANLIIMVGGMIFQPLVGKILDLSWHGTIYNGVRVYSDSAYMHAFLVVPICIFIAGVLAFFLHETYGHDAWDEFD